MTRKMSVEDAAEFAESMDLPDGAYWAMVEDLSGLEPGDGPIAFIEGQEPKDAPERQAKAHRCPQCGKRFRSQPAMRQHTRDAHPAPAQPQQGEEG